MKGLTLGRVVVVSAIESQVVMDSVKDIAVSDDMDVLVFTVLFNLFSNYNPVTGVGCKLSQYVRNIRLVVGQPDEASRLITEEVEFVKNNIRKYQKESKQNIPPGQMLNDLTILKVFMDDITQSIFTDFEIVNMAGEKCLVRS